jgi:LAGLIDADG endonuclease
MVNILNSSSNFIGFQITVTFQLTQHSRDEQLMKSLIEFFDCGKIYTYKDAVNFKVQNSSGLSENFLPFFQKYSIQGVKLLDYLDFVSVIEIMKNKEHLTQIGLDKIRKINLSMNRKRS